MILQFSHGLAAGGGGEDLGVGKWNDLGRLTS